MQAKCILTWEERKPLSIRSLKTLIRRVCTSRFSILISFGYRCLVSARAGRASRDVAEDPLVRGDHVLEPMTMDELMSCFASDRCTKI